LISYIPNTHTDQQEMLEAIGVNSIQDLFADIPERVRLKRPLELPPAMSEPGLKAHMIALSKKNSTSQELVSFLGAGAYDHYIPSVVEQLAGRSEFYTAYTPYQPEISQGTLQSIYEFQSMICMLTGMEVANASLYDGATAVAEAALMGCAATRRSKVLVSRVVHPEYRQVLTTYARANDIKVEEIGEEGGATSLAELTTKVDESTAAVIIQTPNFLGIVENGAAMADVIHRRGALFIVATDLVALGLLKPPGCYDADVVVGEGQSLGNPLNFGGPYLGFFAAREKLVRRMPGRIVGATTDTRGRRGFVLTMQAREQHIRREKATSNICSNEALCALTTTIHLCALGKKGLRELAELCLQKAHYAQRSLIAAGLAQAAYDAPFFMEFAVRTKVEPARVNRHLLKQGIIGGLELGKFYPERHDQLLICVTERHTKEQIDRLVKGMEEIV